MTPVESAPPSGPGNAAGLRSSISFAEFMSATDSLIATGDALTADPEWDGFRAWLIESDAFLQRAWGPMDRYHLAWLNVGRDTAPPGSPLDAAGTQRFIGEVVRAKLAVLRSMRTAAERGAGATSPEDPVR